MTKEQKLQIKQEVADAKRYKKARLDEIKQLPSEQRADAKKALRAELKAKKKVRKAEVKQMKNPEKREAKKHDRKFRKIYHRPRRLVIWGAVVLVLVLIINGLAPMLGTLGGVMAGKFTPDTPAAIAAREAGKVVAKEIADEGMVLLKNEGNMLPLTNNKVNVFGGDAYNFKFGGSGSGGADQSAAIDFFTGISNAGIEYNPTVDKMYKDMKVGGSQSGAGILSMIGSFLFGASGNDDVDPSHLTDQVMADAKAYSNQAIIVFSYSTVEASDAEIDFLKLSPNRKALLEKVCAKFDNVIVIINVGNAVEMGFLEEHKQIKACLWVGTPGPYGTESIGKILAGKLNPSGRMVDTIPYDATSNPASVNFGDYQYDNYKMAFINYNEGIYVGYRYYETRYQDELKYQNIVQFPFGYGLSYTSFEWTPSNCIVADGKVTWQVTVKNTGLVPGKDVVELYFSAPYTPGGIEKSAIELAAYAKTELIQPGDSQTVALTYDVRDMASYDTKGVQAYVLDSGVYGIKLGRNVHNIVATHNYNVAEKVIYKTDEVTDTAYKNLFSFAEGDLTYLSRNDWTGTYPDASKINYTLSQDVIDAAKSQVPAKSTAQMPKQGVENNIKLADLKGLSYDDAKWNSFLDQFTYKEMRKIFVNGGWHTEPVERLGIVRTEMLDGPAGINSMFSSVTAASYPTEVVVASTWNDELAFKLGEAVGNEANALGVHGWYAPAMNLHRTAMGGRNFEYFSEDPLVSGKMSAAMIRGAQSKDVMVYIKHFILNNEETNARSGIYLWSNEQAIRELYLTPFEISVKEGGATGAMSSFTHIGYKWSGGCPELLEDLLRKEWGFVGIVSTDALLAGFMDAELACYYGNDLLLSMGIVGNGKIIDKAYKRDPVGITLALRERMHNVFYSIVNYTNAY